MWLSLNIISKMVDLEGISPDDLALKLTMSTAEIDSIDYMNSHYKSIIAARVLDVKKHPDADKLTLVDLDTGSEKVRVVCGALNHKTGDIVPLATVGTCLTEEFTVKKAKIRGEESSGMLCSERELGISDDHSGIMVLPVDTKVGASLAEIFPHWVDIRLEIDNKSITHRPDLWSHAGFAREIGALINRPVKDTVDYSLKETFSSKEKLAVTVKCPEESPRYSGLVIKGVKIEESPDWLKAAVTSIGMRPINNIVDITNYVMVEQGEPMHAFDRKKLNGDEIFVRMAEKGESLMTLDGQEFELNNEDIVIADKGGAIALAGVMGGGNSEIDDNTDEIVLEAANFNPVNIRKTAGRYNQRTEAAIRFEKSLSPELTTAALIRCYDLIKQVLPGAEAVTEIIDDYPGKLKEITVETTTDHIRKRLGEDIDDERILNILTSLDFKIKQKGSAISVGVPHYRATKDIANPEDIVEEVGRIYGYDNIEPGEPQIPCMAPARNFIRLFERRVKDILSTHYNLIETSGYSFVGEDIINKLKINEEKELHLANPLSSEQDRLRRSLVPNIVNAITVNQRYFNSFKLYELGRVYLKDDRKSSDLIAEKTMLCGTVFKRNPGEPLFYNARNIIMGLFKKLHVSDFELIPETAVLPPYAHPGRSMKIIIEGKYAGLITEIHPETAEVFELKGNAALFDIDLSVVYDAQKEGKNFTELQKFPDAPFELSVLADKYTYSADLTAIIEKSSPDMIKAVEVVSIYEGDPIPEGRKSVSIRVVFASQERTLAPDEIEKLQNSVIRALNKKGYQLR